MKTVEGARAVVKALQVLEAFSVDRPWWTVAELAHSSGLPPTTVARLVSALETASVLRREPRGFHYTLGYRTMTWASVAKASSSLPEIAHPLLETLSQTTGETAALYLRQGDSSVCIDVMNSTQQVHRAIPLGEVGPLIVGAAGLAISAYLPAAEIQRLGFARAELDLLHRVAIFAVVCTLSDRLKDAWAVAAPIHDADGHVHAALVVTGPISRWAPDLFTRFGLSVRAAAHRIAQQLGYTAPLQVGDGFDGVPIFGSGAEHVRKARRPEVPDKTLT